MKITDLLDDNQEAEIEKSVPDIKPNDNKINNLLILLLKIVIFFTSFFGFIFGVYYTIKLFKNL